MLLDQKFVSVPQSEFDEFVARIDRRRYKVSSRVEGGTIKWFYMPIQRRGLFRSSVRDVQKVLCAYHENSSFFIAGSHPVGC